MKWISGVIKHSTLNYVNVIRLCCWPPLKAPEGILVEKAYRRRKAAKRNVAKLSIIFSHFFGISPKIPRKSCV